MARWKARVDFLLTVIERLLLSLTAYLLPLTRYKAKRVKIHCFMEGVGQFEPRFQGKGSSLGNSFYSARNARIPSAVLATAIPSVCPSVCLSDTRRYCVKTTARSTVQFAPLDSKMCLVFYKPKNIS